MRTILTLEDVKNIFDQLFNGNMWQHRYSNGKIPYENPNGEPIVFVDEDGNKQCEKDIAEYLNVRFYTWKNRLVEKGEFEYDRPSLSVFEDWVKSLNFSMDEAYALIERVDEQVVESQDIDSSTYISKVSFLIQTDKISNLEYYVTKIRNNLLGSQQEIQNSYGKKLRAFIVVGALIYDEEPFMTQLGECVVVSLNLSIHYLADARIYSDLDFEISLDGDDEYNADGSVRGETKYLKLPIINGTWQNVFTCNPMPTFERPDLTGYVATTLTNIKTFSFYDFNKELTNRFDEIFWSYCAYKIDGQLTSVKDINIPIYIRVTSNGKKYVFKDVLDTMQKTFTNNDFNICSISTKGWGKKE